MKILSKLVLIVGMLFFMNPEIHLKKMRNRIWAVHLHDNDGKMDLHYRIDTNKSVWKDIFKELMLNPHVETISLETSGIYKNCSVKDIYSELVKDYKTVQVLLRN